MELPKIKISGALLKNSDGRYIILGDDGDRLELTSGDMCKVLIYGQWTKVRIEFSHKASTYYGIAIKNDREHIIDLKDGMLAAA